MLGSFLRYLRTSGLGSFENLRMSGAGSFESPADPLDRRMSGNGADSRAVARMQRRSYNWGGGGHLMQETHETLSELKQRIEHVLRRL